MNDEAITSLLNKRDEWKDVPSCVHGAILTLNNTVADMREALHRLTDANPQHSMLSSPAKRRPVQQPPFHFKNNIPRTPKKKRISHSTMTRKLIDIHQAIKKLKDSVTSLAEEDMSECYNEEDEAVTKEVLHKMNGLFDEVATQGHWLLANFAKREELLHMGIPKHYFQNTKQREGFQFTRENSSPSRRKPPGTALKLDSMLHEMRAQTSTARSSSHGRRSPPTPVPSISSQSRLSESPLKPRSSTPRMTSTPRGGPSTPKASTPKGAPSTPKAAPSDVSNSPLDDNLSMTSPGQQASSVNDRNTPRESTIQIESSSSSLRNRSPTPFSRSNSTNSKASKRESIISFQQSRRSQSQTSEQSRSRTGTPLRRQRYDAYDNDICDRSKPVGIPADVASQLSLQSDSSISYLVPDRVSSMHSIAGSGAKLGGPPSVAESLCSKTQDTEDNEVYELLASVGKLTGQHKKRQYQYASDDSSSDETMGGSL